MQKNETGPYLTPFAKINSKQITYLNIRPETGKLLEENIEENLLGTGLGDNFVDMTPKTHRQQKQKLVNVTTPN